MTLDRVQDDLEQTEDFVLVHLRLRGESLHGGIAGSRSPPRSIGEARNVLDLDSVAVLVEHESRIHFLGDLSLFLLDDAFEDFLLSLCD